MVKNVKGDEWQEIWSERYNIDGYGHTCDAALTQTHPLKLGTLMFGLKGDVKSLIDWSFGGGANPATL